MLVAIAAAAALAVFITTGNLGLAFIILAVGVVLQAIL